MIMIDAAEAVDFQHKRLLAKHEWRLHEHGRGPAEPAGPSEPAGPAPDVCVQKGTKRHRADPPLATRLPELASPPLLAQPSQPGVGARAERKAGGPGKQREGSPASSQPIGQGRGEPAGRGSIQGPSCRSLPSSASSLPEGNLSVGLVAREGSGGGGGGRPLLPAAPPVSAILFRRRVLAEAPPDPCKGWKVPHGSVVVMGRDEAKETEERLLKGWESFQERKATYWQFRE